MRKSYYKRRRLQNNLSGYLFLSPALLFFTVFIFMPVILAFILSFSQYNLITDIKWIGFENFKHFFSDTIRIKSFINSLKFLLILVPVHVGLSLLLAFAVYRVSRWQLFFRSAIYFPSIVTTASVAIAWGYLFGTDTGVINYFVRLMGGSNVPWLTNKYVVYFTIALFSFWKFIGTTFLYYFIGLQNIPQNYYEAAEIDGSSTMHTFFHITVPLLSPTIFFVLITTVINCIQIFDEPYLLTNGGPGIATKTIALEIYETAFKQMDIGYGSTMSFILFLIIMVITVIQWFGQKKWVVYDYE